MGEDKRRTIKVGDITWTVYETDLAPEGRVLLVNEEWVAKLMSAPFEWRQGSRLSFEPREPLVPARRVGLLLLP